MKPLKRAHTLGFNDVFGAFSGLNTWLVAEDTFPEVAIELDNTIFNDVYGHVCSLTAAVQRYL